MDIGYWGKALRSFARHARRKAFLAEVLSAGLKADEAPQALLINFMKTYPDAKQQTVPMGDVRFRLWNMDPYEQFALGALAGLRQPERIFEIGTFDGSTTLLLARMVPTAQIYTLDLPPGTVDGTNDLALAKVDGAGSRFKGAPEAARITQLYGDSRRFDFSPYYGKMDLVVVDGGHEADCVTADTESALKMVSPQGAVVWDDYTTRWPDVIGAVDGAAKRHGLLVARLAHTEFALYDATKTKESDYAPRQKPRGRLQAAATAGGSEPPDAGLRP
jgi:predicted O-methyltransferase YrrM